MLVSLSACDPASFDTIVGEEAAHPGVDDAGLDTLPPGTAGAGAGGAAPGFEDRLRPPTPNMGDLPAPQMHDNGGTAVDENLPLFATQLEAFTGGPSIALRWTGGLGATSYQIFRDDMPRGEATYGVPHFDFPELNGNAFIDYDVAPGATYTYRVVATDASGVRSESEPLVVTTPNPLTQVPTISIDTTNAPELGMWLNETIKPLLEIWYPKLVERLGQPGYAAPQHFSIALTSEGSRVEGSSIYLNVDYARSIAGVATLGIYSAYFAAQVIANRTLPSDWAKASLGMWVLTHVVHERDTQVPGHGGHYSLASVNGAHFLNWIAETYDPTFINQVTAAYDDGIFARVSGGKSVDQLWQEMTQVPLPGSIAFREGDLIGKCVEAGTGSGVGKSDAKVFLNDCAGGRWTQRWGVQPNGNNTISLVIGENCIEMDGLGQHAKAWMARCDIRRSAQQWQWRFTDGSLYHPASGICFDDPMASTANGTQMELWDCNGFHPQNLGLPYY